VSGRSTYPDFLCIGAQKAGTGWLWKNLSAHPDVWMPQVKEIHYFDQKALLGRQRLTANLFHSQNEHVRWRRQFSWRVRSYRRERSLAALRWDLRYFFRRPDDAWYASLFRPAGERVKGEVTPSYCILSAEEVRKVYELMPEARILFFMRQPIERAWSGAMDFKRATGSRDEGVLRNLGAAASRLRTDYLRALDVWSSHYPEEQIFVGFLEDIHFRPEEMLARIYSFLGVGPAPPAPFAGERVNRGPSSTIPGPVVAQLAELYGGLIGELERAFGGYAAWWRFCRERLAAVDRDEVPYPFYETDLWDEWVAARDDGDATGTALQSGLLPEVRRTAPQSRVPVP
jgi:hypothetical protein